MDITVKIMKLMRVFLCICLIVLLNACSKHSVNNVESTNNDLNQETNNTFKMKNTKIPNGIYCDGRIYWEVIDDQSKQLSGTQIGTLLECAKENDLPTADFMGTNNLFDYIGIDIFRFDDKTLYMTIDSKIHMFRYLNQKNVGNEVKENPSSADDNMPTPHVIYDNMAYVISDELEGEFPSSFRNVGEITDTYFKANKNFTGSVPKGSELYITEYQNRFILVKFKNGATYYIFENDSYRNYEFYLNEFH